MLPSAVNMLGSIHLLFKKDHDAVTELFEKGKLTVIIQINVQASVFLGKLLTQMQVFTEAQLCYPDSPLSASLAPSGSEGDSARPGHFPS